MCIISNYYEEKEYKQDEKLFYAIMYRQWSSVVDIVSYLVDSENKDWNNWASLKNQQFNSNTDITIEKCFKYNIDFLKSNKNQVFYCELCEKLGDDFVELENDFDFCTYDDKRFSNGKSVFDIFWDGNQPVLDLKYYEKQTLAAKQVMKNECSMVLDEVGTGKTVAGIYTIQQIIQDRLNTEKDTVKILITCPYNKREDWHNDILRQLGLESTIIDQSDGGSALKQRSMAKKRATIYISGNKGGNDDGNNQQLKSSFLTGWNLVIVDECHSCFDSYKNLKSSRVLLLTATPIVVSSENIREFSSYEERINSICDNVNNPFKDKIKPIEKQNPTDEDIFVCNFKEDIFKNIKINREIQFVECERVDDRNDWFNKLRDKDGFFSAIFSDQDDEHLAKKMSEKFPDKSYAVSDNYKLNTLINVVLGECRLKDSKTEEAAKINYCQYKDDSFIVFCETTGTVDLIYEKLSKYANDSLMIGKLHSQTAEIKNHQTNKTTILQILKTNIRKGNKSVLITTGKSGGTGINLGEFSTVVHYELPFSSNELEQRFGRIERADDLINVSTDNGERKDIQNKMIFLINKSEGNELDFITNRMLYYSINKINITVQYMPTRNTVLFHPVYIKRVTETGKAIWDAVIGKLDKNNGEKNNGEKNNVEIQEVFQYYQETNKIKILINNIFKEERLYSSRGTWNDISHILNNTSNLGQENIDLIRDYKNKYEKKSQELDKKLENYKKLVEIQEVFQYYQETNKIEILINNILKEEILYSSRGTWNDISHILNNTSNLGQENIDLIRDYKQKYEKKSQELDKKLENYKKLIEYYLFLKKTLLFWGIWEMNNILSENDFEITNADTETGIESESNNKSKIIDNIIAILNAIAEDNDKVSTITTKIENMIQALNQKDSILSNKYSGVFYMKDNKIANKTFDERNNDTNG